MAVQCSEDVINIAILVSGNGSNMENLIKTLHNKRLSQIMRECQISQDNHRELLRCNTDNKQDSIKPQICCTSDPLVNVKVIISNKEDAYALTRARNLNIQSHIIQSQSKTREEFDFLLAEFLSTMRQKEGLDCILLAGFMRILGEDFLDVFRDIMILNIHPSFLPHHKGKDGIKESFFDKNYDFGGVSVHVVSKELDSGRIILQEKVAKIEGESLCDFTQRIHELEYRLYPRAFVLAMLEGKMLEGKMLEGKMLEGN